MRAHQRILIIDDDGALAIAIANRLKPLGFQVLMASDGVEGLNIARERTPDLIILDIMLPEIDGFEVCRHLKLASETKHIPILMMTAQKLEEEDEIKGLQLGADDYLKKSASLAVMELRVKALLRRSASPPFAAPQNESALSLSCEDGEHINVRVIGPKSFHTKSNGKLNININTYARRADDIFDGDWRCNAKKCGRDLYDDILGRHQVVLSTHQRLVGSVRKNRELHLLFECNRSFLRVPLEFLYDGLDEDFDYLVLQHPLARSVKTARMTSMPLSPSFFNDLWKKGGDLRIMLIASNTVPNIPGVDDEIDALNHSLKTTFEERDVSVKIKVIPTKRATFDMVKKTLLEFRPHVFHYAGHGAYDEKSPENSSLSFWEAKNQGGNVKKAPISELQMLFQDSDVLFAYLSCCQSTQTGSPDQLRSDDFLGIADGIIHAGVPSVLGFRWPVSDEGAKDLALAFYRSLAEHGQLDTALLDARSEIARQKRNNPDWLSPILIMRA